MTSDQARKLLGGYATNSLTEAERKALFEAALDDQELFDALQQEQALKELLADPVSRNQIQHALAVAPVPRPAAAWWSRAWLWGGVVGAVAATILIVIAIRPSQQPQYQVARVAPPAPPTVSEEPARPAVQAPVKAKPRKLIAPLTAPPLPKEADNALRESPATAPPPATASAPPPPPAPQPQAAMGGAPRIQAFRQESSARINTLLRYSLAKRDAGGAYSVLPAKALPQPGDAVQLNVSSALDGSLYLYQLDPSGNWKQIFPATGRDFRLAPNATATVPDSPIIVTDMEQKFRLTLQPADGPATTVEITIGPEKVP